MIMNYKKISELEEIAEVSEGAYVPVLDNGSMKKVSMSVISETAGGGGGSFMVHADATSGTGEVIIDKSFDEIAAAWDSGQNIVFRLKEPWGEHDYAKNISVTNEDGSYSDMSFVSTAMIDYLGGEQPYLSFSFIKWAKGANMIEVHYAEFTSTHSGLDNEYNLPGTDNPR